MPATVPASSASHAERPLGFEELQANIEGGAWDRIRLTAKFIVSKMANTAHELFVDLPKSILRAEDPVSYQIDKAGRDVTMLQEIGAWAVEREIVPADATAQAALPRYNRLF